jgi:hypothetical protein
MRMFEGRSWRVWTVALAIGLILLPFAWPLAPLRVALLLVVAVSLAGTIGGMYGTRTRRGKYDLKVLRRELDRDERRALLESEMPATTDHVFCASCGEEFDARLPVCPRCRKPA